MNKKINGMTQEQVKQLLQDDPEFAEILLNVKQGKIKNQNVKLSKKPKKQKTKQEPTEPTKQEPTEPTKQEPTEPTKQEPTKEKKIGHRTNDPNKATNDPNIEPCKDPNCKICEKPIEQNQEIISIDIIQRIAKMVKKYPKMAYVYDDYKNDPIKTPVSIVKANLELFEKMRGNKK